MKKPLKILSYSILILIILCVFGSFLALRFINPNDYKDKITELVHEKTGRDLVIKGEIELSFFPWIGARVHDVQFANAPGFQPAHFVRVDEADVRVKLMPLLSKQVEVGRVTLRGLELNLAKNKQGITNWQDLTAASASNAAKTSANTSAPQSTKSGLALLSIAGVDIENATISWTDAQKDQTIKLKNVEVKSDTPAAARFFPVSLTFDIASIKPDITGHFTLNSDVLFDRNKATYQLKNLRVTFAALQKDAPKLSLQVEQVLADLQAQTLVVTQGVLSNGDLSTKLSLQGQKILDKPVFQGQLDAAPFDLKKVLKTLGKSVVTTDPNALQKVSLHAQLAGTASSIQLDPLTVHLDSSNVQGALAITDFATQALRFDINIDQLNVDNYLPPKSAASAATPGMGAAAAATRAQPAGAMAQANINGRLRVGKLVVAQTELTKLSAKIALQKGLLNIAPLSADIYKGSMDGKVTVDFRGGVPKYSIDETLSNIDMSQLVKSGRVVGRASVATHLTLQGQDKDEMMRNLNGSVRFNVQNGALVGTNIPYQVDRAISLLKRLPAPPSPAAQDRTSFDTLQGTGIFNGGIFSNNDLIMQSPEFKGTGNGTVNVPAQTLDYHLRLVGLQAATDTQGKTTQEERQTAIPVHITGTFDKPIVTPDLKVLIQSEVGKKAIEKIQEKLGPDAGRAVGGLLELLQK